jgi:uncharacterized membrane protein YqgA involved in biofilm formation
MLGTIINVFAVISGSLAGFLFHRFLPKKVINIAFHAIGLFTIVLGVSLAIQTQFFIVMIISLIVGSIIGEIIDIHNLLSRISNWIQQKTSIKQDTFTQGFITSFLLFCMGSLTILGSIEEGLGNPPNLLITKSMLDGFSSIALAASMGIGVMFSAIPLFLYQGGLTIGASYAQYFFTTEIITEISAVGGVILIGLGIDILEIKSIKTANMLPSLVIAVLIMVFL